MILTGQLFFDNGGNDGPVAIAKTGADLGEPIFLRAGASFAVVVFGGCQIGQVGCRKDSPDGFGAAAIHGAETGAAMDGDIKKVLLGEV